MAYSILVATAHTPFGELIRLSLEETRRYRVQVVDSGSDAAWQLESGQNYVVAIVDGELADLPVNLLSEQARLGLKLFLVPSSNGNGAGGVSELPLTGTVSRPFYLPELLDRVAQAVEDVPPAQAGLPAQAGPPAQAGHPARSAQASWEMPAALVAQSRAVTAPLPETPAAGIAQPDAGRAASTEAPVAVAAEAHAEPTPEPAPEQVDRVAEFKAQLGQIDALCGMWVGSGRDPILAGLDAVDEGVSATVSSTLREYLPTASPKDRHPSPNSQRGIHSTPLGSWIRFVRLPLADSVCKLFMTSLPGDEILALVFPGELFLSQIRAQAGKLARALPRMGFSNSGEEPGKLPTEGRSGNTPPSKIEVEQDRWFVEGTDVPIDEDEEFDSRLEIDLGALLGTFPDPNPPKGAQPEAELPPDLFPWNRVGEDTQAVAAAQAQAAPPQMEEPPVDPLEDTQPHPFIRVESSVLTPPTSLSQLEPEAPGLSQIFYTCVLIPRLPHHYLTREIGDRVGQWLQQLCLAFDWRLEGIAIRPEYLQWMVQVAPSVSPGGLVKVIRQRTSYYLFSTFAQLREENPSDDFWAAGYLVISGAQPPAARLLREFIRETRRRQGAVLPGDRLSPSLPSNTSAQAFPVQNGIPEGKPQKGRSSEPPTKRE
jgi:REP element-mobilizing transposase RayT